MTHVFTALKSTCKINASTSGVVASESPHRRGSLCFSTGQFPLAYFYEPTDDITRYRPWTPVHTYQLTDPHERDPHARLVHDSSPSR